MRQLIAQLKRNIYEVKGERETFLKDISQGRKIFSNLQRMKEQVAADTQKMQKDFQAALKKTPSVLGDLSASVLAGSVSKSTASKKGTTGKKSRVVLVKPASVGKMKALRF